MNPPSGARLALPLLCLLMGASAGCGSSKNTDAASKEPSSSAPKTTPSTTASVPSPAASAPRTPSATASASSTPIAAVPKGAKTHGFTECTPAQQHLQGATLSVGQLVPLAAAIKDGLCWGYFKDEVTAEKLAASMQSCANALGSTAFEVSLELVKGQCNIEVGAGLLGDRVFVRTQETYVTQVPVAGGGTTAGVGYKLNAFEVAGDKFTPLFSGMPCEALDDAKLELVGTISKQARQEWKMYPSDLRQWFCR